MLTYRCKVLLGISWLHPHLVSCTPHFVAWFKQLFRLLSNHTPLVLIIQMVAPRANISMVPSDGLGTIQWACAGEVHTCVHPTSIKGWLCPTLGSLSGVLWSRTHLNPWYQPYTLAESLVHSIQELSSYSFCWPTTCQPRFVNHLLVTLYIFKLIIDLVSSPLH